MGDLSHRDAGPAVRRVLLVRPSERREAIAGRWAFLLADVWDAELAVADPRVLSAEPLLGDPGTAVVTALPPPGRPSTCLARVAGPLVGVPRGAPRPTPRRGSEVVCAISAHGVSEPAVTLGVSVATALGTPLRIVMSEAFDERVAIFLPFDQICWERRHDQALLEEVQRLVPAELPLRCETSVKPLVRTTAVAAASHPAAVVATQPPAGPLHHHRVRRLLRAASAPIVVATGSGRPEGLR